MRFILEDFLKPTDSGIEWGSGRSTAWLARRVRHVVSVEDNQEWFERVKAMLAENGLAQKVDYRLKPEDNSYPGVADQIEDGSLDFALVDGKLRSTCALKALSKIKVCGALVVDNVSWFLPAPRGTRSPHALTGTNAEWELAGRLLATWRCIWTSSGVNDTALWIKTPTSLSA